MSKSEDGASLRGRKSFEDDAGDDYGSDHVKSPAFASSSRQDYDEGDDDDYIGADDDEDSRAILLQELGGPAGSPNFKKAGDFDASDDSPAAMVHRVSPPSC